MGWCAIEFCDDIWKIVRKYIPKDKKAKVACRIYNKFREHDMDDCCGDSDIEKYIPREEEDM